MPVHEELGRNDVELLAHVLADAHHLAAAVRSRAHGVFGLVTMLDPAQMLGQRLALGAAALVVCCLALRGLALELLELRLEARLVIGHGLFEQAPLLGAHRLGLGTELPGLQPGELEGDLLQLGGLEPQLGLLALELARLLLDCARLMRDALVALLQVLALLAQLPQHPPASVVIAWLRPFRSASTIMSTSSMERHRAAFHAVVIGDLPIAPTEPCSHVRMTAICSRRCHGSPSTSALNCACVSVAVATDPSRGQRKRPWFTRRAAHHMPKPSCTSSLMRVPRTLENRYPWGTGRAGTCTTRARSPSAPARMSDGSTASHTASIRHRSQSQPQRTRRPPGPARRC
jgi:hypothetical protein